MKSKTGTAAKQSREASVQEPRGTIPPLDETQKEVIATLSSTLEFWQTAAKYNPLQSHDSVQTRYEAGVAIRKRVSRESHAPWKAPANRPTGVDFVIATNQGRQQDLVPLRMGRMAASPFAFLRGAAAVMAWDFSHTPISGIQVVIDGDAHINNFGLYGTAQRDVVVDLNDFDESMIGPWEWDLKRLVASVNVAARENGLNKNERRRAVKESVRGYRLNLERLYPMGIMDLWSMFGYADRRPTAIKVPNKSWTLIQKTVQKARATTNETLLTKVARRQSDGGWRFVEDPPILTRLDDDTRSKVIASLSGYSETLPLGPRHMLRRYSVADVAHRIVGVGSVGTRAYLLLLFGNGDSDPLFLQVKESVVPAHAPYLPPIQWAAGPAQQGMRVVSAQRMLQASGDPLLGFTRIDGRDYFVRQMKNMKASMPLEWLVGEPFYFWAFLCAALLARGHSRMGDSAKIAGYCGRSQVLDEALADFAEAYGDQTEKDHASLVKAIKQGKVKALEGI